MVVEKPKITKKQTAKQHKNENKRKLEETSDSVNQVIDNSNIEINKKMKTSDDYPSNNNAKATAKVEKLEIVKL